MGQLTPKNIALLLIVLVALYIAVRGFKAYCDRVDAEWAAKNPPLFPPELNDAGPVPPVSARQKEIAAEHCAKVYIKRAKHFSRYATAAESEGGEA